MIDLKNYLVYRSVENKNWSLENKMWSPLKLEATDHKWFPTASLYSILLRKDAKSPINPFFHHFFTLNAYRATFISCSL